MDTMERGQLLADQEQQVRAVSELQDRVRRIGRQLSDIGNALQKEPEKVTFMIATDSISQKHGVLESLCFNTDKLPTWLELQQLIENLKGSQQTLQHTQRLLGMAETPWA